MTIKNMCAGSPSRGCPTTRGLMELGSAEGEGLDDNARQAFADLIDRITALVQDALSEGAARGEFKGNAEAAALHIVTVTRGLAVLERAFGDEGQLRKIARGTVELVLGKKPSREAERIAPGEITARFGNRATGGAPRSGRGARSGLLAQAPSTVCRERVRGPTKKRSRRAEGNGGSRGSGYNHATIRQGFVQTDMMRISFKGVAIGNVVDIVATNVVMVPVIIYVLASTKTGSPPDHGAGSVTAALKTSHVFLAASSILGGLCSILGGYVSARIAKHDEVLNGTLSSILCVGFGVYAVVKRTDPLWLHLLYLPLSLALGALGGYLRSRQTLRIV